MNPRSVYRESARPAAPHGHVVERVKRVGAAAVLLAALLVVAAILGGDGPERSERWTFLDAKTPDELGLVAQGTGGIWALEDHEHATGGRALANHEGPSGDSPALLVATQSLARDVRARTRCKVVSALVAPPHAACGVLFRFVDRANYWVVRVDVGTGDVEAAAVVGGEERILRRASVSGFVANGSWSDLDVEARGDVVRVALGGRPVLVAEAPSVLAPFGLTGLWASSEAAVLFDHFTIETLTAVPQALEILPLLGRRQG